jgi:hypothetical protein
MIVVDPSERDKEILKNLQDLSPNMKFADKKFEYLRENVWEVGYQITLGGVDVDVFVETYQQNVGRATRGTVYKYHDREICLNPIPKIVAAKKRINRSKDWKLLFSIGKLFTDGFNLDDFTNYKRDEQGDKLFTDGFLDDFINYKQDEQGDKEA